MTQPFGEEAVYRFSYPQEIIDTVKVYVGDGSKAYQAATSGSPELYQQLLHAASTSFTPRELLVAAGHWERAQVEPGEREAIIDRAWKCCFINTLANKVQRYLDETHPRLAATSP